MASGSRPCAAAGLPGSPGTRRRIRNRRRDLRPGAAPWRHPRRPTIGDLSSCRCRRARVEARGRRSAPVLPCWCWPQTRHWAAQLTGQRLALIGRLGTAQNSRRRGTRAARTAPAARRVRCAFRSAWGEGRRAKARHQRGPALCPGFAGSTGMRPRRRSLEPRLGAAAFAAALTRASDHPAQSAGLSCWRAFARHDGAPFVNGGPQPGQSAGWVTEDTEASRRGSWSAEATPPLIRVTSVRDQCARISSILDHFREHGGDVHRRGSLAVGGGDEVRHVFGDDADHRLAGIFLVVRRSRAVLISNAHARRRRAGGCPVFTARLDAFHQLPASRLRPAAVVDLVGGRRDRRGRSCR